MEVSRYLVLNPRDEFDSLFFDEERRPGEDKKGKGRFVF